MEAEQQFTVSKSSQISGTPKLSIELFGRDRVSRTLPIELKFVLKTEEPSALMLDWHPMQAFQEAQFVLLHKTESGVEECHLEKEDSSRNQSGCPHIQVSSGTGSSKFCLLRPNYHKYLKAGQTYVLFWPGAVIKRWDRKTTVDHIQMSNCGAYVEDAVPVFLPASNSIEFTVFEEAEPWPQRDIRESEVGFHLANKEELQWRLTRNIRARKPLPSILTEDDREPDAPILSRKVEGLAELSESDTYVITETTTYKIADNQETRPITFLDHTASERSSSRDADIYSLLPESGNWLEALDHDVPSRYGPFAALSEPIFTPDDEIDNFVVGDEQIKFHTLYPGESISSHTEISQDSIWDEPFHVGEKYIYRFNGLVVRWWDWGTLEDHKGTKITGFDQQPKLVIPSALCEFTAVP